MDHSKLTILLEELRVRVQNVKRAIHALEHLERSRGEEMPKRGESARGLGTRETKARRLKGQTMAAMARGASSAE